MSTLKPKQFFGDFKRQIQIEMVLKKINLDSIEICDAILEYNEEILTQNICEILLPIMPNESEFKEISKITENKNTEELSLYELFILLISGIPLYKERLESIIFKFIYNNKCLKISSKITDILNAFNFIKNNSNFHQFLDALLEQTELIKNTSFNINWKYGILIASLPKIYDMKSKDNKTNILQYSIETFLKNDLNYFNFIEKYFHIFETFNLSSIKNDFILLDEKFKNVQILKNMVNTQKDIIEDDDNTETFLLSFYEHAQKSLNLNRELKAKINKEYNEMSECLGLKYVNEGNIITIDNFIEIMKEFFIKTSEIIKKQTKKKSKKQCEKQLDKKTEKLCEKQTEKLSEKQCEKQFDKKSEKLCEKKTEKLCEKQCVPQFEKKSEKLYEKQPIKQSEKESKKQFETKMEK